jgi:hypothetical protein
MNNAMHKFLSIYLFLFTTLYMFRAHRTHHQERQIVSIQPLVTVILCRVTVTRGCIETICLSWWWARCAWNMYRVIIRNKYIEKDFCIMLVIYRESLHDALSTKCKSLQSVIWLEDLIRHRHTDTNLKNSPSTLSLWLPFALRSKFIYSHTTTRI